MIEEALGELGLNKRETACYLALLELGSSKVGNITAKTEIPSSKIYEILEKLIKKGLVTYVIKNNIKHFQASDPKVLLNYLEEKEKKVKEILPELIKKQQFSRKQSVEIFEGRKAIQTLFIDLIADGKPQEMYLIYSTNEENTDEQTHIFFKNLTIRRKEKKMDSRLLRNIRYYDHEKHKKIKIRYTEYHLPQGITIFKDKLILLSWGETPVAIKIQSNIFAEEQRKFFLELWEQAKE